MDRLRVHPNPARDELTVLVGEDMTSGGQLRIWTMDGRLAMEQVAVGPRVVLNVEPLSNGPYLLELVHDSGHRSVSRFVKQ